MFKKLRDSLSMLLACYYDLMCVQFGHNHYRQKEDGALGTGLTCTWAILTFATMEMLVLTLKCKNSILFFKDACMTSF